MYDEFGRLKKKFRSGQDRKAREAAALARLRGDPIPVRFSSLSACCLLSIRKLVWKPKV